MDSEKLIDYLESVVSLEKQKFTLGNILDDLDRKIKYNTPFPKTKPAVPISQYCMYGNSNDRGAAFLLAIFLYVLLAFGSFTVIALLTRGLIIPALLSLGVCIFLGIIAISVRKKHKQKNKEFLLKKDEVLMNIYKQQLQEYENEKKEYEDKKRAVKQKYILEKNQVQEAYDNADELLTDYYAKDVIPEGYRMLIPVTMIYQYLKDKRTYSLERSKDGNDPGAINIYEQEKMAYSLITSIEHLRSDMNYGLSVMQQHQKRLYNAIQQSREEQARFMTSVEAQMEKQNNLLIENNNKLEYNNYLNNVLVEQNQRRNELMLYGY